MKKTCWQRPYFGGKKLGCKIIKNNTGKRYDEDYEIGRIRKFIGKLKDRQLKKLKKKIKELEDKIEILTSQITQ